MSRALPTGITLAAASLTITSACVLALASAEPREHDEAALALEYGEQVHSLLPDGDGCLVYDLTAPCEPIPGAMAPGIVSVLLDCEVRGWWSRWESPADVVSPTGDYGMAQLNQIHAPAMAQAGLIFTAERDRIRWAVKLWETHSWAPWSCGR